ncbi:MAG: hypothetical protein AMS24_04050 [Chlamydiae bacterium SM23_39]|nr:MAG: hypothetical protein AMS24_04050 [Chlamydiae bacterium SM23_39]
MLNPYQIEKMYQNFVKNLSQCLHEDIINVDLKLLKDLDILDKIDQEDGDFTQYFHVIETPEKVTLFNEQFIIWIVPKMEEENPITYVMIALHSNEKSHLEIVFTTSGVYNTPKYVLKILQHYLLDMLETEATITAYEKDH